MPVKHKPVRAAWDRYRNNVEYQSSPFPFPPRRMTLFDKLHRDFIVLTSLVGAVWLIVMFVVSALS